MTSYLWFVSAFCLCEWLDCLSWGVCNVVSFLCISYALFCRYKCQLYTQEGGNKTSDVYVYLIFCCKVWFLAQWCWDYCSEETNAFISDDLSPYWSHTHLFNGLLSGVSRVSWYLKGKTNLAFTKARDSEWQWHQLGRMQIGTWVHTDNHCSTPPLSFLQAGCPSCYPTNSIKAMKAQSPYSPYWSHSTYTFQKDQVFPEE